MKRNYDVIRAQHDALLGANRQKEELTALIVHDLKNPLSSILSNAQYVLSRKQLGPEECESLDDVVRASQSMVRLVMNLLDVSRSEDGALIPHVTEFDLTTLLSEVCKEMGRRVEDKDQQLQPTFAAAVGPVRADRDLIRRVLENLIDNAYKYGPRQTTIRIEILAATMDDGAEPAIEIRVRDEGEGVPVPYRQLIFEKYARVDGRAGPRRAAATAWVWCSAGARSAFTGARSGSRTARGVAAASAFGCPSRACRCPRRVAPLAGAACGVALPLAKRGRLADETPGTRRLLAEYRQEVWSFTDRMFLWLLLGQAVVAIATALQTSPQPWDGLLGRPVARLEGVRPRHRHLGAAAAGGLFASRLGFHAPRDRRRSGPDDVAADPRGRRPPGNALRDLRDRCRSWPCTATSACWCSPAPSPSSTTCWAATCGRIRCTGVRRCRGWRGCPASG